MQTSLGLRIQAGVLVSASRRRAAVPATAPMRGAEPRGRSRAPSDRRPLGRQSLSAGGAISPPTRSPSLSSRSSGQTCSSAEGRAPYRDPAAPRISSSRRRAHRRRASRASKPRPRPVGGTKRRGLPGGDGHRESSAEVPRRRLRRRRRQPGPLRQFTRSRKPHRLARTPRERTATRTEACRKRLVSSDLRPLDVLGERRRQCAVGERPADRVRRRANDHLDQRPEHASRRRSSP